MRDWLRERDSDPGNVFDDRSPSGARYGHDLDVVGLGRTLQRQKVSKLKTPDRVTSPSVSTLGESRTLGKA